MSSDRDLFDDSTMTFGEHLEELRTRLIKALYGVAVGAAVGFFIGGWVIEKIKQPLVGTLEKYEYLEQAQAAGKIKAEGPWEWLKRQAGLTLFEDSPVPDDEAAERPVDDPPPDDSAAETTDTATPDTVIGDGETTEDVAKPDAGGLPEPPDPNEFLVVNAGARGLAEALRGVVPALTEDAVAEIPEDRLVPITLQSPVFAELKQALNERVRPITLTVQEGFFTYLKVSLVVGVVLASPWIFYQAWLFVAAGLYPHERRYVYRFGPMSLGLFFVGAAFAWLAVIPFALDFFIGFSTRLGLEPNIQIGQWIGFAVILPVVFGIAFQMPLLMLFVERIGVLEVADYREKRAIATLVMAVLSAVLTPQDPITLLMMLIPLMLLYQLGIWLCVASPKRGDFAGAEV